MTSFKTFLIAGLSVTGLVLFTACDNKDEETAAGLTAEDYDEVAAIAGSELSSAIEGDFADLEEAANYTKRPGSLGKEAVDTTFDKGPFTISLYRKFAPGLINDSSDVFIKGTSTSMVMKRKVTGDWTKTAGSSGNCKSASVNKYHYHRVTGLDTLSAAITLNGTSSRDNYRETSVKNTDKTFHIKGTGTKTDVVINKKDGDTYPESGTSVYNFTIEKTLSKADKTVVKTITVEVKVTFNGTATPDVLINKDKNVKINLTTGEVIN